MSGDSSTDPLASAQDLCKQRGLFIVERFDTIFDKKELRHREVRVWIVYRGRPGCGIKIGKRRDPGALLRFVRKLI